MVAGKRTRKNVAEGVKFLRSANGQFAGSVGSGEKPKKPQKPKAKAVVGQLDTGQKGRLAKTLKEKYTVEQLKKKKVAELKEIALGLGATEPTKYKNRKDSWIAEINKAYEKDKVEPKKTKATKPKAKSKVRDMFGYTGEELSRMKVDELEVLVGKVGGATPAKYRNRRQSWLDELEKIATSPPKTQPEKLAKVRDPKRFEVDTISKRGSSFAKQYIVNSKYNPGKEELELKARKDEIEQQLSKAFDEPSSAKNRKIISQLLRESNLATEAYYAARDKRLTEVRREHQTLLDAIYSRGTTLSRKDAKKLVGEVEFDDSIPDNIKPFVKTTLIDYYQLTGGKGSSTIKTLKKDRSRAYADPTQGLVSIGAAEDGVTLRRTLFHEFSHHLECEKIELIDASVQWRNNKATSDYPVSLRELTGIKSYTEKEVAYEDKYIDPYVGKYYYHNGKEYATEVMSMGVEHFSSVDSLITFRHKAPDHFNYILGVLLDDN